MNVSLQEVTQRQIRKLAGTNTRNNAAVSTMGKQAMSDLRQSKRAFGDGAIDLRGKDSYRLRYRVGGRRFTKTFHGTLSDARKELRALIRSGDNGDHVAPDKIKLSEWIDHWIGAGAPGRKKRRV